MLYFERAMSGTPEPIEIPNRAPRIAIEVQGRRVFLKDHDEITATGATVAKEQYLISLKP